MHLVRLIVTAIASIFILTTQAFASGIELTQVTSTSVTATIQPDSAEIGKTANIWMGALYGSSLFLRNGANWTPYTSGPLPLAVSSTILSASMPLTVVTGLDVSLWPGLQLYLGYGASESDMMSSPGKLAQIYPSVRPASVPMTIRVTVPTTTPAADTIWLRTLNFQRTDEDVKMTKVSGVPDVWEASVTAPEGTILRYSYRRNTDWSKAETYSLRSYASGFHYREALVRKNGTFSDSVAQWQDLAISANSTGTIRGVVTSSTGAPLMGIRVSAGPHQTMSRWDGSYRVLGVPVGSSEITFRADNGEYFPTRTSANVSPTVVAMANVTMAPATMASVTFNVIVPSDTPTGAGPRLFADTYRLGGFQEFEALAPYTARVIDMTNVSGTAWSYTVNLGIGTCVTYTYTLGTTILNNERDKNGVPVHRSLCVIGTMAVNDTVDAWKAPSQVPIALTATSPTGADDTLYVTTDDAGKAPVKMWPTGTGKASYVVYSAPNSVFNYRYVRDGDNELGIEIVPPFDQDPALFRSINSGATGTATNDTISAWRHQMRETALTTVQTSMTGVIGPRASGSFQTGVEFIDYWRPNWRPLIRPSVARLKSKNVKWVQVTSFWGLLNMNPPLAEQGWNSFTTEELIDHIREVKAQGMSVALRTGAGVLDTAGFEALKGANTRDGYDLFFDELKAVLMYHATIAQQEGVEMFIIPYYHRDIDTANLQAEPAMKAYYNAKWKSMVAAVRSIAPSVKLSADLYQDDPAYDWQGDLDYLGDKWWVPLGTSENSSVSEMYTAALDMLKTYYQPISARFSNKPFLFAEYAYNSTNLSGLNWKAYPEGSREIDPARSAVAIPPSDYDKQARAIQATLLAFAATPWVQGAYSFAYWYFDFDSKNWSIRAKTAEEIMSQIYQQLNGM